MILPSRCAPLAAADGWRLTAVLGGWRGKSLFRDAAWVSPDGRRGVTAGAWAGGDWGEARVGWSELDLETGEELARGEAAVSRAVVEAIWFAEEGDAVFGVDEEYRGFRVELATRGVARAFASAPTPSPEAWQRATAAARPEPLRWLGADATGRYALAAGLACGERDALARVDLARGEQRWWHAGHAGEIEAMAFGAGGERLATRAADRTARVWDVASGACAWTFEIDEIAGAGRLRLEGDGRTLAAWFEGVELQRWDLRDGVERERAELRGRAHGPGALSPDGDRFVACDADRQELRLWDLRGAAPRRRGVRVRGLRLVDAGFASGGATLRALAVDGPSTHVVDVAVARVRSATEIGPTSDPPGSATDAPAALEGALSDDGTRALLRGPRGFVWLDADARRVRATLPLTDDRAPAASALTGSRFALAARDEVTVRDDDGRAILRLGLGAIGDLPTALAIAPGRDRVAIGTALGAVLVYDRA